MAEHPRNTKFLTHVNALFPDTEQLLEAGQHVKATMDSPGWEIIAQLLEEQMSGQLNALVRHVVVRTEAEYASMLAEVRGMQWALDAGQTVLDEAEAARGRLIRQQGTPQ